MTLYAFLRRHADEARPAILTAAVLSGLANTSVLVAIAAARRSPGESRPILWLLFAVACALYVYSYSYCVNALTALTESAVAALRQRLCDKLARVDLGVLDKIGPAHIYHQITQQTAVISDSAWLLSLGLQAVSLLSFVLFYILYLSQLSFITIVILCLLAVPFYLRRERLATASVGEATALRVRLFSSLNDFLAGFKEVRLRQARGEDLQTDYDQIAAQVRDATIRSAVLSQENFGFINFNFYVFLALIVFVLPPLFDGGGPELHDVTAAALFLMGPLGIVAFALPQYGRASLATESLRELEASLDETTTSTPPGRADEDPAGRGFSRIALADVQFAYAAPSAFTLGPVSLEVRAGEIVFFVGGNGSGKTTLLKTLAGLYVPTAGSLRVDDRVIDDSSRQAFRENIAAVFTDFHLFRTLYGLQHRAVSEVTELLSRLRIAHKTAYGDRGFTRIDLSTGQRKRLAMVVALLEDRPLLIFDEWAADQDPEFRRYYYEELLPDLKRRGKTILAISHDDRYFHCADRVVTLDYGTIRSIDRPAPPDQRPA